MRLLFRRKSDGRILKPIQTLDSHVRLQNAAGGRVWWAKKDKLQEDCDILTHDIERGDVLRDIRDGSMWIVEYVGLQGLRMQSRKDGVAGMTYFGLVNYERVGRKYRLRDLQPHEPIRQATREIVEVSKCCGAEVVRDPGGQAFCRECAGVL